MINSKQKGNAGEREWVKWLKENLGIRARRGQQFKGTPDSPDVISDLKSVHWEVKRVEKLNLGKAMTKAIEDAKADQMPIVAHRKDGDRWNPAEWMITLQAKDLVRLSKEIVNVI